MTLELDFVKLQHSEQARGQTMNTVVAAACTVGAFMCIRLCIVAQLVETLCYKSEGLGFDSPMVSMEIFHRHNPSGRTMALRLTQPLTEMITRNISGGDRGKGGRCVGLTNLTTFMCRLS